MNIQALILQPEPELIPSRQTDRQTDSGILLIFMFFYFGYNKPNKIKIPQADLAEYLRHKKTKILF